MLRARWGTPALCVALAVGCSPERERGTPMLPQAADGAVGGTGGAAGVTGGAGGVSGGGAGGTGGAGGAMLTEPIPLDAQVEDSTGMTISVLVLECAGDCAQVVAVASGGRPPYVFEWEDGSTEAEREVCLEDDAELGVTVTETVISTPEFPVEAQSVSAMVTADVLDPCDEDRPPGECEERAPAGSFDPVVKWTWDEPTGSGSLHTPLVANLTDDNDDGVLDALDTPDIVLSANQHLLILDGATGDEHFRLESFGGIVGNGSTTPALGDIDGDGVLDILTLNLSNQLTAFDHEGELLWTGDTVESRTCSSLSIADLDADGTPEIIGGVGVYSSTGTLRWSATSSGDITAPTAADLDDDGFMEVTWGHIAYRHDGSVYYDNADIGVNGGRTFPAIADLDGDEVPEVVVAAGFALFVLDNEGVTLRTATFGSGTAFPPAIHDLDGDELPEIMVSDGSNYRAFAGDLTPLWAMPVIDSSSDAAGTAFDFLGDGTAEAMYGDETTSWGFDGETGAVIFMQPRTSGTLIEYPTIADVDNDGSADMLITSDRYGGNSVPILQVISDSMNRWIPARRIMNQDTYHVTNVNDDGTIPQHEVPHWKRNNSFRTQSQIDDDGEVCIPVVEPPQ